MNKSYLMMVSDQMAQQLTQMLPGLQFLEVQGMDVTGSNNLYKVLIAPMSVPIPSKAPDVVPEMREGFENVSAERVSDEKSA